MTAKLSASSDGSYASLSVGANEAVRFGNDYSGQLFNFRNKIINGDMLIHQRGSLTATAGTYTYCLDRMIVNITGANAVVTQATISNPPFLKAARITGAASISKVQFGQRIEAANSACLAGKNVVFSFWAYQDSGNTATIDAGIYRANTEDTFSAITQEVGLTLDSTTLASGQWKKFIGKGTLSINAITGLYVYFNTTVALGAGTYLYITGLQLEEGVLCTPFEFLPIGFQRSLCQRYFETLGFRGHVQASCQYFCIQFEYKQTKRSTPVLTLYSAGTAAVNNISFDGTDKAAAIAVGIGYSLDSCYAYVNNVTVSVNQFASAYGTANSEL